ncbi:MAG TPA: pyridoxal 5'-phosphate synthase glutaminase subunit PdxT [Nocardioidaceae bacterium]|nr:pyridoxal 5'-phosphate synthase glutaminase subunit PdxT [Nocardioidaceae bacterium]
MTYSPTIGVLALQGDVREHLAMLERSGAAGIAVRRPAEIDQVDGVILPGGESTTMYKLARAFELFEPLRDRLRDGLPALGTCAGMIMLADRIEGGTADQETIGGLDVVVRRNAFGRQVDSFEADLEVTTQGPQGAFGFHALFIRAPWVEKVGQHVEVLAKIATGPVAGRIVAIRQANLLATSFHPEITGDHRIHQLFVDTVQGSAGNSQRGK